MASYSAFRARMANIPVRKLVAGAFVLKLLALLVALAMVAFNVTGPQAGLLAKIPRMGFHPQLNVTVEEREACREHSGVWQDIGLKVGYGKSTICVTHIVYLDLEQNGTAMGRLEIALFGSIVPQSASNFAKLATCEMAKADPKKNAHLCYHGDSFHRILPGFVAQGGSHATGRSVFGGTFSEMKEPKHHSFLSHASRGVLAWAEFPIGSQFYITLSHDHNSGPAYLDANHVVFGYVMAGESVLDLLDSTPLNKEEPKSKIWIVDSGLLPLSSHETTS
ncbi:Peptidyl-prolyl cis-trans isomerase CYP19-4 [Porphyridium purpureum]|uniref:Peptidyl-prolyl cis-trans isomerase n=1 Tax=Porphyridium purpureum TaxID=35688 RepID=A0A5J4Z8K0_PORPP|nr:Peptidyl-prolyl cis-trans isomerase CYP19-4 [Porphyridium purpureum]|eukprot:POR9285..scf295_1